MSLMRSRLKPLRNGAANAKDPTSDEATSHEPKAKHRSFFAFDPQIIYNLLLVSGILGVGIIVIWPEVFGAYAEAFKRRLENRRQEMIVATFLHSKKAQEGDTQALLSTETPIDENSEEANDIVDFMYHIKVANEIQDVLFSLPVSRYGIITGTRGSGKSAIVKELVKKKPYVAVIPFDLVNSVKYLVDTIADKVGYDFDDMTERLLQSYVLKFNQSNNISQTDKLSFLLQEIELACKRLKSHPENTKGERAIIIFDDINRMDLSKPEARVAIEMLFNAAYTWARNDTALVVFTLTNSMMHHSLSHLVGRDTLAKSRAYTIGGLNEVEADRFLQEHMGTDQLPTPEDRKWALSKLGTHLSELRLLCQDWRALNDGKNLGLSGHALGGKADEATKTHVRLYKAVDTEGALQNVKSEKEMEKERRRCAAVLKAKNTAALKSLVERYITASEMEWRRVFSDINLTSTEKEETLAMLDHMVAASKDRKKCLHNKKGTREYVRSRGLLPVLDRLLEEEMGIDVIDVILAAVGSIFGKCGKLLYEDFDFRL
ncbi:hypothetical protein HDV05_008614 [Chytridiales sp. JEL 0842]|nr:hypothetical protein HDV05_008614 [Chytridiales sp. JEL 0842]